jgi:hypothetical protein
MSQFLGVVQTWFDGLSGLGLVYFLFTNSGVEIENVKENVVSTGSPRFGILPAPTCMLCGRF